jgi:hypothetical protein
MRRSLPFQRCLVQPNFLKGTPSEQAFARGIVTRMSALADWRTARHTEKANFFEFVIEELIEITCWLGDIAIDAGANYGAHTATMLSASARTHAFEPKPELAAKLESRGRERLTVHRVALSDRQGFATFHFANDPGAMSSILGRAYVQAQNLFRNRRDWNPNQKFSG